MITYTNIKRYLNLEDRAYRDSSGFSFSFLKNESNGVVPHFEPNEAMRLGSGVHDILSGIYRGPVDTLQFAAARNIAMTIKKTYFADSYDLFVFETSYFAEMGFKGLTLKTKGRTDCELTKQATIDFKITGAGSDRHFAQLIKDRNYPEQVNHYGNLAETPARYILPYSTSKRCCLGLVRIVPEEDSEFWKRSILNFGSVKE